MKKVSTPCTGGVAALVAGSMFVLAPSPSGAWAPTGHRAEFSILETAAPEAAAAVEAQMPVDCLRAFSKDYCDSLMVGGDETILNCPFLPTPCTTATVANATMVLPLFRNLQACDPIGPVISVCDESPQTDGTLKADMRYEVRLHKPCKFRGCWSAKWELHTVTGAVFQGDAMGTIGVGTNRKFTCPEARTDFCENCLDVQFIGSPFGGTWRIGFEGAFQGKRIDAETGERLCFTVNADWYLEGDANGPFTWAGDFKIKGTADGVHIVPCGF